MSINSPEKSSWYLVRVILSNPTTEHYWDLFTTLANDAGSVGNQDFLLRENITGGEFYFDAAEHQPTQSLEALKEILQRLKLPTTEISVVEVNPTDWIETGKRFYEARSITDQFVIGPPEERWKFLDQGVDYISIEYGAAFGTGSHPTTVLCLQLMQDRSPLEGDILDFGTGTGVLAFAALHLGAELAYCIDCSPEAEPIFIQNAQENGFSERVVFHLGSTPKDVYKLARQMARSLPSLIVCNMLLSDSEALLSELAALEVPLIYSGYLEGQSTSVRLAMEQAGFRIELERFLEDWGACLCIPDNCSPVD